jgi:hypothetical protein
MIEVRRLAEGDPLEFEVVVREGRGETHHHVPMYRECAIGSQLTLASSRPRCRSADAKMRGRARSGPVNFISVGPAQIWPGQTCSQAARSQKESLYGIQLMPVSESGAQ